MSDQPYIPPVSLADIKRHLRIDCDVEDDYLTDLLAAATAYTATLIGMDLTSGAAPVPVTAKHAIRLLTGHWYENREAVTLGAEPKAHPLAYDALILQLRGVLIR